VGKYILDLCRGGALDDMGVHCPSNPEAATRVVEAAHQTFRDLAATPGLGRPRHFRNPRLRDIRSWRISGFDSYLIFYRIVPPGVQVLHVYHGAQDIEGLFETA